MYSKIIKKLRAFLAIVMAMLIVAAVAPVSMGAVSVEAVKSKSAEVVRYAIWRDPRLHEDGEVIENFEKEYGIDVQIDIIARDSYAENITALIAAGDSSDIYYSNGDFPLALSCLQPLTNAGINLNDSIWDKTVFELTSYNGYPYLCNSVGSVFSDIDILYYNKNLLAQADCLTPEEYDAEGNWNWDALEEIATACSQLSGKKGLALRSTEALSSSAGGSIFANNNGVFSNGINDSIKNSYARIAGWNEKGILSSADWRFEFTEGKVAMVISSIANLKKTGDLQDMYSGNIGFYTLPKYNADSAVYTTGTLQGFGLVRGASNPIGAGKFLRYYLDSNNYDGEKTFISDSAEQFYYANTTLVKDNYKPYWTLGDKNEIVTDYDDEKITNIPFNVASNQVISQIASCENAVNLAVQKMNNAIADYIKDAQISIENGWVKIGNYWYYLKDGVALIGWQLIEGKWYYFGSNGAMLTGWQQIQNQWYFLDASGEMKTGWLKQGNTWYYLTDSGAMATGWVQLENGRYYMNDSGVMQTGWLQLDSGKYYLTESGAAQIGWFYIDGVRYMFDGHGKMIEGASEFIIDVSKWQGDIDWEKLSETDVDGVIVRTSHGSETKDSKFEEYISELNRLCIPYGLYHYNTATTVEQARSQARSAIEFVKSKGANPTLPFFVDIEQDGDSCDLIAIAKVYIEEFIKSGYKPGIYANTNYWTEYLDDPEFDLYYKWVANYGVNDGTANPKYSSKEKLKDYMMWQYTDKGRIQGITQNTVDCNVLFDWYTKADGWKLYNNNWYYYLDGYISHGWRLLNGSWYYFRDNGTMATGWQYADGWYYFNQSGIMLTSWQIIDGVWYYFDAGGKMLTGWQNIGGAWYYFNASGAMVTGWQYIGSWYYFNSSGVMVTGWQSIDNQWYYFDDSGAMFTGWLQLGGTWYYFNASGAMLTGWQVIDGAWYYFYSSGAMAVNCYIDGYWINASGVWS